LAYVKLSSATPGGNPATFCSDLKNDGTVMYDLVAVEDGMLSGITGSDMSTAAANATRMASEAPQNIPGPAGAYSGIAIQPTLANIAKTLTAAATKMARGDTSGYTEYAPAGWQGEADRRAVPALGGASPRREGSERGRIARQGVLV
jgi:hypothetical protein